MPLLPCKDHTKRIEVLENHIARITALETQVAALVTNIGTTLDLQKRVIEVLDGNHYPALDPDLPGYHR